MLTFSLLSGAQCKHRDLDRISVIIPIEHACILSHFSTVWLFATLWTAACQTPLSMGFSRKSTGGGCHALLQGIFVIQGSNLHLLCLLHSQGLQKLFPQVSPAGKHNPVLQKYSSCKEQLLPGFWVWPFTQALLPHASHPWIICAGIKKGPWQFSRSSQQAPHTRCGLCGLSSRPFCSLSGIRVHTSQLPPGSWSALECMGQRGAMVRETKKKSAPLPILHFSLCSAQQTKVQVRVRERGFTFET